MDSALVNLDRALEYLSDSVQIARASCIKGLILTETGRYKEATEVLLPLLPFCEKNRPFAKPDSLNWIIDGVYSGLAKSCTFTGDYRTAIRSAYMTLELGLLFKDRANMQARYANLGIIYYKLRDNVKAIEMYEKAIRIPRPNNNAVPIILSNMALCYSEMDSVKTALCYTDSAVYHCGESCPSDMRLFNNFNYGMIYIRGKSYELAKRYLKNSLKDAIDLNELRMMAEDYVYLARAHIAQNAYDSAGIVLRNSERIAHAENFNEILLDVYRQYMALYGETNDYQSLAEYQKLYLDHKQKLHNSELAKDMVLAEWRMVEQTHENELARKESEIWAQAELIGYQQWLSRISILVVALMCLLTMLLVYQMAMQVQIKQALIRNVNDRSKELKNRAQHSRHVCCQLIWKNEIVNFELEKLFRLFPEQIDHHPNRRNLKW